MLEQSDYLGIDAVTLSARVQAGDCKISEITECAFSRAESVEPIINSIVTKDFEKAMAVAKSFDTNPKLLQPNNISPGFPLLIKDLSTVKGLTTTLGSNLFKGSIATNSSAIVQRYKDAGLNIFGLTNTPEFGLTITTEPIANGVTRNPWDPDYSTGGSSGGAAAAVASGISPVAHATDGGGSIRIPAACCGVFGLKPSRGLTVIDNKQSGSWGGMSIGHVVSQSVKDSAAFLDIIKLKRAHLFPLPPSPDSFLQNLTIVPKELKIGLQLDHPLGQPIDQECIDGANRAAQLCEALGHNVDEISHPIEYGPVVSAMAKIINTYVFQRVATQAQQLNISPEEMELERSTKITVNLGRDVTVAEFLKARDIIFEAELIMREFHQTHDVIISPVLAKTPAKIGWLDMNSTDMKEYTQRFRQYSGFTSIYNGTGQPSMSVPLHRADSGLPVGVMFTGAWGSDLQLLRLARQLEEVQPWPRYAKI
ncbi:MAG: amidase [Gammaproteobacteria bacterium]|nr:amidase [Gammaproteobacteria bacterium]